MVRFLIIALLVLAGVFFLYSGMKVKKGYVEEKPVEEQRDSTHHDTDHIFITPVSNPYWQLVIGQFEAYLKKSIKNNQAPGVAVAIVQDSSILFTKGYGLANSATRASVDVNSVFRLGSVSKSFAGILTALLVQEGVFSWNDKVTKYVPSFRLKSKAATDSLTIAHLLSHTTGLPYHAYTDRVDAGTNFDTLIYHLRNVELIGSPGKIYSYQNVGFSIISKVIESATGKSYEQVMTEKIFRPLAMANASLQFDALMQNSNKAFPHTRTRKDWKTSKISTTYYNVGPAGGMNASINDMARWLRMVTNPHSTLLAPSTKEKVFKPAVKAIARNRNFRNWKKSKGSYYAMGWRVLTFKDDTLNYHGGYVNGYRSEIAIKRDDRIGICVLVNSAGPLADNAIPEFLKLYDAQRTAILKWEREHATSVIASEQ